MRRRGLGIGRGMGYRNIAPMDSYVHSLSAKGVKSQRYFDRFVKVKRARKSEERLMQIERGFALPTVGAVGLRSVSAVVGLGFGATGFVIPAVIIGTSALVGVAYAEEKYFEKKALKGDLDAQTTLTGELLSDEALQKLGEEDAIKFERHLIGKERVKFVSDELVKDIKNSNIPFVEEVYLDDFNDHSGTVFVALKSKDTGDRIFDRKLLGDADNLPDAKKFNLRKVTDEIRKVLKKNKGNVSVNYIDVPKREYSTDMLGDKDFEGYSQDFIEIDYEVA